MDLGKAAFLCFRQEYRQNGMLKELSILVQRRGRQRDRHEVRGQCGCPRISSAETAGILAWP